MMDASEERQLDISNSSTGPPDPGKSLTGVLERIVYENEDNGFFVGRLRVKGEAELVTFVGQVMAVSPGETVRLWGDWVEDRRFGRQFKAERYETVLPSTAKGIEKYLGSGLVDGVGPKYARRLVEAFGVDTLRVIDEEPRKLRRVQGIGPKRAARIREAWEAHRAQQSVMVFLQGHGVGTGLAVRIYKQFGDGAAAVLRENPYRLAEEVQGVAFKTADTIARSVGIAEDAPRRIEAGLVYVLQRATSEGHVFLTKEGLFEAAGELLGRDAKEMAAPLANLDGRGAVVREGEAIYLQSLYNAETGCVQHMKRLALCPPPDVPIDADRAVAWTEKTHGIALSEEQKAAIRTGTSAKTMVITGGPGTGKTTILNSLIAIFEKKKQRVLLAAPTGRAAKRMEAATDRPAKTIHRLLEFSPREGGFQRDYTTPLDGDIVVVDETSMVDVVLFHALLQAVPSRGRLFLVGDVDQLPSVGPGSVLMDVIASQAVPVVWLRTVFRQAAESGIVSNAHRINRGQYPEFNMDDFFLIEREDGDSAAETIVEVAARRLPDRFGLDPVRDIQVLAPMHRGAAGVEGLNERLQATLNPGGAPVGRRGFRVGDKVMQLRNNYELDVYNGDVGVITVSDEDARELQVRFDDREVLYDFDHLDELRLAYAATIHKSQGSEYPAVVISLLPQHFMMLQRNVLYTAITRGRQLVVIVGEARAVATATRSVKAVHRNSRLAERLRQTLPTDHST